MSASEGNKTSQDGHVSNAAGSAAAAYPGVGGVIVTGGGSGIGAAICARLAADGLEVGVLDRREDLANECAERIGGVALIADVADSAALAEEIQRGTREMGGLRGLVNNAGVGNLKRFEDYSDSEIDLIMRVNLLGTYYGMRTAVPLMVESGGGAIVNIASVSGVRPTRGEAPYSAAKAAVIALSQAGALEFAPSVRVNCISPGFIRTPLNEVLASNSAMATKIESGTPLERMGAVEDVAELASYLLSERAGYLTGQNLVVDGGSMLTSLQMDSVLGGLLKHQR
ncbi:MAG TPA: SDR family NAD(P)-dependent oxidoreductase [Microthrixaceae bacterium]|nr:SDR family NAD(P)-dependent oxidoreductase [Microthrixaceae bacterium]